MTLSKNEREILSRGTEEIVPEKEDGLEEVSRALDGENPVAYVGYEPSGKLHIGHLLTAVKLKDLEDIGFNTKVLLADTHAYLNGKPTGPDGEQVSDSREVIETIGHMYEEALKGWGLENTEFVWGSDLRQTSNFSHTNENYLEIEDDLMREITTDRADRAVAEMVSSGDKKVGHSIYPVRQVADVYALDADIAVGGIDQRAIHMLARDHQPEDFDNEDKPVAVHTPLISVNVGDGEKMSSSGTAIEVYADKENIEQEVNDLYFPMGVDQVKNDFNIESVNGDPKHVLYDSSPVLQLVDHYVFGRKHDLEVVRPEEYGGDVVYSEMDRVLEDVVDGNLHPADVKNAFSESIYDELTGVRENVTEEQIDAVESLYN